MSIRRFTEADLSDLLEIYAQSKLDELRFEKRRFKLLRLEEDPERLPKILESTIYVYEDRGIVGFGALFESQVRALFVSPNARGKGVGKALLSFLLSKNSGEISLHVASSNWPAIGLYRRHGFQTEKEFLASYNGQSVWVSKMVRPSITDNTTIGIHALPSCHTQGDKS